MQTPFQNSAAIDVIVPSLPGYGFSSVPTRAGTGPASDADAIATDLAWLGIAPDRTFRQSDRIADYEAAAERLKAAGVAFYEWRAPHWLAAPIAGDEMLCRFVTSFATSEEDIAGLSELIR